jgi:hypothetical protein
MNSCGTELAWVVGKNDNLPPGCARVPEAFYIHAAQHSPRNDCPTAQIDGRFNHEQRWKERRTDGFQSPGKVLSYT